MSFSVRREKLITVQPQPEFRFNGRAHVTIPGMRYLDPQKNQVLLYFKTYASDGLIYLVGHDKQFFSVLMQEGQVFLQVSAVA